MKSFSNEGIYMWGAAIFLTHFIDKIWLNSLPYGSYRKDLGSGSHQKQFYLANSLVMTKRRSRNRQISGRKRTLNKVMRGDVKKFKVYVRDKKSKRIKKIEFGARGMSIKKHNPQRRKSFRARHQCSTAKDRMSARYWSCKMW
jgi:hypothetical protein